MQHPYEIPKTKPQLQSPGVSDELLDSPKLTFSARLSRRKSYDARIAVRAGNDRNVVYIKGLA